MNRRLLFVVVVVAVVLGLSRLLFHGHRTLALSHSLVTAIRDRHESEPHPGFDEWMRGQPLNLRGCERDPRVCTRFHTLLATTPGLEGRLPNGLQVGTAGPIDWKTADSWLNAATVVFADRSQVEDATCVDALRFSAFLVRHGGADGERVASRLMLIALPECARRQPDSATVAALAAERGQLVDLLGPMLNGFAIDGQVRRFGSWLTPEDLASLDPGMRALAATAPPPPFNPLERNARGAMWQRAFSLGQGFITLPVDIKQAMAEWPERVSDPKRLGEAYEEEKIREAAVELVLDAWNMKQNCTLGTGATSTVKADGDDCVLENQSLHVQLPSRKE